MEWRRQGTKTAAFALKTLDSRRSADRKSFVSAGLNFGPYF